MPAPSSTYRVQLHAGFDFDDAAAVVDYLAELGVTHLYCSPYLQAAPGSTHGYDVVDPSRHNVELGGRAGRDRLAAATEAVGLGTVLDLVPNHMAVGLEAPPGQRNGWWWDVLRHGREAEHADWFDVDWDSSSNPGRVVVPVLGAALSRCMERGEIVRGLEDGEPVVRYYRHTLPVAPGTEHIDDVSALLDAQHYRLCHWRIGSEELNYRRFFDVTTLAGVRVERPEVFDASSRLILEEVAAGRLDGLRIDHPDGLADPEAYLRRLAEATGGVWTVVEKILEPGERLPDWDCAGTTGYDVMNRLAGLLVDPAGEGPLTELYGQVTGEPTDFAAVVRATKSLVLRDVLVPELERLTEVLVRVCRADPVHRDLTRRSLREALVALLVAFPVYRAYVDPDSGPSDDAGEYVRHAVEAASAALPRRSTEIAVIGELVLGEGPVPPDPTATAARAELVTRFQQTCGPVMAKGVEDTAFYRYVRLVSLNEVGGDPARFGVSVEDFHTACAEAQERWPLSMTALSTHDTKRSEDVRARLAVLSEVPDEWAQAVRRWTAGNERHRTDGLPDRNIEYLLYQTLVGAWPLSADRAVAYLEKASREAKQHTSWVDKKEPYDTALVSFVRAVLADGDFVGDVERFVGSITDAGRSNSLAQKLLQLTMPGVADTYQGTELWDHSLVDPDNRRPVDYAERRRLLGELPALGVDTVAARADEGVPKLLVVSRLLRLRREHPEWFGGSASYAPLLATGARAQHVVAFGRSDAVVAVATRLPVGLARAGWGETSLTVPGGGWQDLLSGRRVAGPSVRLADLLCVLPVALLVRG